MRNTCKVLGIFLLFTCGILGVASAQTFTTLVRFNGTNEEYPWVLSLAQDLDGTLNGTTENGGSANLGVTFRLSRGNQLSTVNSFDENSGTHPQAGVILASDGSFYGTTTAGGEYNMGTVFRVTRDRKLVILHQFSSSDGYPTSLIQGIDGRFYGTTDYNFCGGVFEMSPEGKFRMLHYFARQDGCSLNHALVQDANGDLYGTANTAGIYVEGALFKVSLDGTFGTLHNFNQGEGAFPNALILATDGNFYGTTTSGGAYGRGTVFRMAPDGSITTLYSFCGMTCGDGENPDPLIQGSDGNLYGATEHGGPDRDGSLFELSLDGTLTNLHKFKYQDGISPVGLTQFTDGKLYGATGAGGGPNEGTLFRFDAGLPPFVTFVLKYGRTGQTGQILGQGFTEATDVSINGTPASFTVVSDTYIKATIPQGATSGYVTVTTPTGVLTSNVPFTVLP